MSKSDLSETETLELKKSTSELKEAVISIAAILNKHGKGVLYFGIRNDGKALGQDVGERTIRDVSQAISENIEPKIYPKVAGEEIDGKTCIKAEFSGNNRPYYAYGRAYMRVGDEDRQISAKELEDLILEKNRDKNRWETKPSEHDITDVSPKILKDYLRKANEAGRLDYKYTDVITTLKKLGLVKGNTLLNAGEALFSKKAQIEVQTAVFAGTDRLTFLDIQQYKGNIFTLLEKSEGYIKEHMNWRVEIGRLQREEIPEVPVKAIREALINSLCHRDYDAPESNKIAIYKDRIDIYNPGRFPEGYTPEDFLSGEQNSIPRNPLIADTLYKSKDIEKWGSGLKRIYEECRQSNVKVEYKTLKDGFSVVFYRKEGFGETPQKTPQKATPLETKILEGIKANPEITRQQIAEKTGIAADTAKEYLNRLKKKGLIRRIGPDKGGRWEIVKSL